MSEDRFPAIHYCRVSSSDVPGEFRYAMVCHCTDIPDDILRLFEWEVRPTVQWTSGRNLSDDYPDSFLLWTVPGQGYLLAKLADDGPDHLRRPHSMRIDAVWIDVRNLPDSLEEQVLFLSALLEQQDWNVDDAAPDGKIGITAGEPCEPVLHYLLDILQRENELPKNLLIVSHPNFFSRGIQNILRLFSCVQTGSDCHFSHWNTDDTDSNSFGTLEEDEFDEEDLVDDVFEDEEENVEEENVGGEGFSETDNNKDILSDGDEGLTEVADAVSSAISTHYVTLTDPLCSQIEGTETVVRPVMNETVQGRQFGRSSSLLTTIILSSMLVLPLIGSLVLNCFFYMKNGQVEQDQRDNILSYHRVLNQITKERILDSVKRQTDLDALHSQISVLEQMIGESINNVRNLQLEKSTLQKEFAEQKKDLQTAADTEAQTRIAQLEREILGQKNYIGSLKNKQRQYRELVEQFLEQLKKLETDETTPNP